MYSLCKQNKCFRLLLVNLLEYYDTDVKCRRVKDDRISLSYAQPEQFQVLFSQFLFNITTVIKIQILNFNVNK